MTTGKRIREARKAISLTQKELAAKTGIAEITIRNYEADKYQPKIEQLQKIANALKVSYFDITGRNLAADLPWDLFKETKEWKQIELSAEAADGIISILAEIYGYAEMKHVDSDEISTRYCLIGAGENQFVLYDGHIDALHASVKASLIPLVEQMRDSRPEDVIIAEIEANLKSEETKRLIAEYLGKPDDTDD